MFRPYPNHRLANYKAHSAHLSTRRGREHTVQVRKKEKKMDGREFNLAASSLHSVVRDADGAGSGEGCGGEGWVEAVTCAYQQRRLRSMPCLALEHFAAVPFEVGQGWPPIRVLGRGLSQSHLA